MGRSLFFYRSVTFQTKMYLRGNLSCPVSRVSTGGTGETSKEQKACKKKARERCVSGKKKTKKKNSRPILRRRRRGRLLRGSQCSLPLFLCLFRLQLASPAVSKPRRRRRVLGDHKRALLLGSRIGLWRGQSCARHEHEDDEQEESDNRRGQGDNRRAKQQRLSSLLPPPPPRWPRSAAVAWHRWARVAIQSRPPCGAVKNNC